MKYTLHLIAATAALLLACALPLAAAEAPVPNEAERAALGISAYQLGQEEDGLWRVKTPSGDEKGFLVNSAAFATDVRGFAGPTPVFVYIDEKGIVRAAVAAANAESSDQFGRARAVLQRAVGLDAAHSEGFEADAVSGATLSSRALTANVAAAIKAYRHATASQAFYGELGTIFLILALVIGVVLAVWLRRKRKPSCCR